MHIEEAYRNLANAIIIRAADDYRRALNGEVYSDWRTPESVMKEVEKFFHSSWYRDLTKVDGDFLIEQLKLEHSERIRKEQLCESN